MLDDPNDDDDLEFRGLLATPPSGVKPPPDRWIALYGEDVRRMHPEWSEESVQREATNLATEAANPRHKFWW